MAWRKDFRRPKLMWFVSVFALCRVAEAAETGRLVTNVAFPLEVRGKTVGEMKLPPESLVVVLAREKGRVFLQSQAGTVWAEESAVRITDEEIEFPAIPEPGSGVAREPRRGPRVLRPSEGIFRGLPKGSENVPSHNPDFEQDVFHLVNAERRKKKLHELSWNEDLARAARYHAADMSRDGYFCHDTRDVVEVQGKLVHKRVGKPYERFRAFHEGGGGENIAGGQRTPGEAMHSWMTSTGHRANILREDRTLLGVGFVDGTWVQVFGR
jgi:uncharacterized protein YkwD